MATLHSPRQGLFNLDEPLHSPRQGLFTLDAFHSPRQGLFTLGKELHSPRQAIIDFRTAEFNSITQALNEVEWMEQARNLVPRPAPSVEYAGLDLTPILGDLSITLPLNGKGTAKFDLQNPADNGLVTLPSPLAPPGHGDFAGKIRQHNGTAERAFRFSVTFAGEPWQSDDFVPQPVGGYDGSRLSWGADDLTALLEQDQSEEEPLDDILKGEGDLVTAHQAIQQEALRAGVTVECRFPDYLIGEFRRGSGSPLSRMDALAKPMQAARRRERGRFIYEQWRPGRRADWRFVDRLNIRTLNIAEFPRAANTFTLVRFTPAGAQIGEAVGRQVGRQSISFTPSRFVAIDEMRVVQGDIKDYTFKDESGTPLAPYPLQVPAYSGAVPAASAEFTYEPRIGQTVYEPLYELIARGEQAPRETDYRFDVDNAEHQAIYGVVRGGTISEPILGDAAGAALAAVAYLAESTRKVWKATLETPYLNPFVAPGQVIEVKDYLTQQNGTLWTIEQVTMTWRGRAWSMQLECSRGEE